MPRYSRAVKEIVGYLSAIAAQRKGTAEAGGLLGFESIWAKRMLDKAMEKQYYAKEAMERRRGGARAVGGLFGGAIGSLLGPVGTGIGAGIGSYLTQRGAGKYRLSLKGGLERGVRAKRIKGGKFYTETKARANRALRDWIKDYRTSQVTGALTDAFSAYQIQKLGGKDIAQFLSRFKKPSALSEQFTPEPLTMQKYFSTQNPYGWNVKGLEWGG